MVVHLFVGVGVSVWLLVLGLLVLVLKGQELIIRIKNPAPGVKKQETIGKNQLAESRPKNQ